jgi:ATP-dependent Lon protease
MDGIDVHVLALSGGCGCSRHLIAGVTLVTVLTSLLSDQLVPNDTGMAGKITIPGAVLPVGGVEQTVSFCRAENED